MYLHIVVKSGQLEPKQIDKKRVYVFDRYLKYVDIC